MSGTQLPWSAERFYWSLLEVPQWKRAGELPAGLRMLLEEDVPVPVDSLHAVGLPLRDGRVLVCAVESAALQSLSEGAATLTPERVPEFVGGKIDPSALNLLVGAYEPRPLRRARFRRHLVSAAALLVASALVSVGLLRRATMWERADAEGRAATAVVLGRTLPKSTPDGLALELGRTRRLADAAVKIRPPRDAASSLESLVRAWPASVSSKPQSVAISESGASISVSVEGDATAFLKAMKPPPGWSMDEPRLNATEAVTRLTLQLRPPAFPGVVP